MKRFILSTFSVLLAASAVAPAAQALPPIEPDFKLQTLRLREFDIRNKSEGEQQPYYPYSQSPAQTPASSSSQSTQEESGWEVADWETTNWEVTGAEEAGLIEADSTAAEVAEEVRGLSLITRRHELLDRN